MNMAGQLQSLSPEGTGPDPQMLTPLESQPVAILNVSINTRYVHVVSMVV